MCQLAVAVLNFTPLTPRTKNRHKKTSHKRLVNLGFLVGTRGFEPPTPDTP